MVFFQLFQSPFWNYIFAALILFVSYVKFKRSYLGASVAYTSPCLVSEMFSLSKNNLWFKRWLLSQRSHYSVQKKKKKKKKIYRLQCLESITEESKNPSLFAWPNWSLFCWFSSTWSRAEISSQFGSSILHSLGCQNLLCEDVIYLSCGRVLYVFENCWKFTSLRKRNLLLEELGKKAEERNISGNVLWKDHNTLRRSNERGKVKQSFYTWEDDIRKQAAGSPRGSP